MTTDSKDFLIGWRQRGEAEEALRKWRRNQQSPTFIKGFGAFSGLIGGSLLCWFVSDPSWTATPALFFIALFLFPLFYGPSEMRAQEKARAEAKATLKRLGVWGNVEHDNR